MDSAPDSVYFRGMRERDKAALKVIANICGNISAIAVGIAIFDGNLARLGIGVLFAAMALYTVWGIDK